MNGQKQTVAVLGLGYVGCVTAACLAELGHTVIGVDRDQSKVKSINAGHAPFYEPGLEALVENGIRTRNLRATTSGVRRCPRPMLSWYASALPRSATATWAWIS